VRYLQIYLLGVWGDKLCTYLSQLVDGVLSTHLLIWSGWWNAIFPSIYLELAVVNYRLIHLSRLRGRVIPTRPSIWGVR